MNILLIIRSGANFTTLDYSIVCRGSLSRRSVSLDSNWPRYPSSLIIPCFSSVPEAIKSDLKLTTAEVGT